MDQASSSPTRPQVSSDRAVMFSAHKHGQSHVNRLQSTMRNGFDPGLMSWQTLTGTLPVNKFDDMSTRTARSSAAANSVGIVPTRSFSDTSRAKREVKFHGFSGMLPDKWIVAEVQRRKRRSNGDRKRTAEVIVLSFQVLKTGCYT